MKEVIRAPSGGGACHGVFDSWHANLHPCQSGRGLEFDHIYSNGGQWCHLASPHGHPSQDEDLSFRVRVHEASMKVQTDQRKPNFKHGALNIEFSAHTCAKASPEKVQRYISLLLSKSWGAPRCGLADGRRHHCQHFAFWLQFSPFLARISRSNGHSFPPRCENPGPSWLIDWLIYTSKVLPRSST